MPALTGRHPNRAGKISCPFHEDHTPSLQLYEHDWYCYGACRTGGSIYDLGALLYGLGTRGHDFLELRERLAEEELLPPRETSHLKRSWCPCFRGDNLLDPATGSPQRLSGVTRLSPNTVGIVVARLRLTVTAVWYRRGRDRFGACSFPTLS